MILKENWNNLVQWKQEESEDIYKFLTEILTTKETENIESQK